MKAENEQQVLEHMGIQFKKHGALSGLLKDWTAAKVRALDQLILHAAYNDGRLVHVVLDIGVGDLEAMAAWPPFQRDWVEYTGVDGCDEVLERARKRFPEKNFDRLTFSQLIHQRFSYRPDAIVALDVLYHIPDDELYEEFLAWLFDTSSHEHRYVLLSHALDVRQTFSNASKPGDPGFAWFAREFQAPEGWEVLHTADAQVGTQRQRLVLLYNE